MEMITILISKALGAQAAQGDLPHIKVNPGQYAQSGSLEGHLAYHLQLRKTSHMVEWERNFTSGYIEVLQEELKQQREVRQAAENVVRKLLVTVSRKTERVVLSSPQAWEIAECAETLNQRGMCFDYRFLYERNYLKIPLAQPAMGEATNKEEWLANLVGCYCDQAQGMEMRWATSEAGMNKNVEGKSS